VLPGGCFIACDRAADWLSPQPSDCAAERLASYLAQHAGADWNDPDPAARKAVHAAGRGHANTPAHARTFTAHRAGRTTQTQRTRCTRRPGPQTAVWEHGRPGGATGSSAEWLLSDESTSSPVGAQGLTA
jgi:hypothetical protein